MFNLNSPYLNLSGVKNIFKNKIVLQLSYGQFSNSIVYKWFWNYYTLIFLRKAMFFYVFIILISFKLSFLKSETCSDDNLIKPTFKDLWGYEFNWNNLKVKFISWIIITKFSEKHYTIQMCIHTEVPFKDWTIQIFVSTVLQTNYIFPG